MNYRARKFLWWFLISLSATSSQLNFYELQFLCIFFSVLSYKLQWSIQSRLTHKSDVSAITGIKVNFRKVNYFHFNSLWTVCLPTAFFSCIQKMFVEDLLQAKILAKYCGKQIQRNNDPRPQIQSLGKTDPFSAMATIIHT